MTQSLCDPTNLSPSRANAFPSRYNGISFSCSIMCYNSATIFTSMSHEIMSPSPSKDPIMSLRASILLLPFMAEIAYGLFPLSFPLAAFFRLLQLFSSSLLYPLSFCFLLISFPFLLSYSSCHFPLSLTNCFDVLKWPVGAFLYLPTYTQSIGFFYNKPPILASGFLFSYSIPANIIQPHSQFQHTSKSFFDIKKLDKLLTRFLSSVPYP